MQCKYVCFFVDVFTSENLYPVPGVQLVRRGPIVNSAIVGEEWKKKKLGSFGSGREMKNPTQTSLVFVPLLLSHRSLFRSASQIERLEKA